MSMSRWAKLGALTTRLAGSTLSEKLQDTLRSPIERLRAAKRAQQRRAEMLVSSLSRLKGAAMKLGQQAAVIAQHLDLPPEIQERLATLHDKAEPVPFDVIRATVEHALGGPLADHFVDFDEAPLGTASLAQAHAARLPDGAEVVVKVLHPDIDASVQADLLALRTFLWGGRAAGRPADELRELFAELEERLLEELDYEQEAANIEAFREAFGDDPRVRIPRVYRDLSTARILTLDRLPGKPLGAFVEEATDEARQRAGLHLADFFFEATFLHRTLHADPHPGNFLFEPDGRVGVLDYGCVKRFDAAWIGTYARLVRSALAGDHDDVLAATRELGAWRGDDPEAAQVIVDFCEAVVDPLRHGPYELGADDADVLSSVRPVTKRMWRYPEIRGPRHLLFLHRTLGGLYTIARRLGARADWPPRMVPHLDQAVAAGERA